MLKDFIAAHRHEIVARCRMKVQQRTNSPATVAEVDHGVPMFLAELTAELEARLSPNPDISITAARHGHDLLLQGLTPSDVVHSYGDVCQSITEMAVEKNAAIRPDDFRMLNRCLDDAIASAITQYTVEHEKAAKAATMRDTNHIHVLSDALSAALTTASGALAAIKDGTVGVGGSTGALLERSLAAAHALNERLLKQLSVFERQAPPPSRWGRF
jgi:hypothetical protein